MISPAMDVRIVALVIQWSHWAARDDTPRWILCLHQLGHLRILVWIILRSILGGELALKIRGELKVHLGTKHAGVLVSIIGKSCENTDILASVLGESCESADILASVLGESCDIWWLDPRY